MVVVVDAMLDGGAVVVAWPVVPPVWGWSAVWVFGVMQWPAAWPPACGLPLSRSVPCSGRWWCRWWWTLGWRWCAR